MNIKDIIGNIYYRNSYDGLDVFRVFGEVRDTLYCRREYDTIQETVTVKRNYFNSGFKLLSPIGKMIFMILDMPENTKDVAIVFLRKNRLGDFSPEAICRQNIIDMYSSMYEGDIYNSRLGMSLCKETAINDDMYKVMLMANGISSAHTVSTYLDDRISNIVKMVPQLKFNVMLKRIKKTIEDKRKTKHLPPPKGLCESIFKLMINTGFDDDYYRSLGILTVPISLRKSYENRTLEVLDLKIIENMISKHLVNNMIVKYTKDVEFDKIKKDYILVADRYRDIYIVVYDKSYPMLPDYAGNHLDILRKFRVV